MLSVIIYIDINESCFTILMIEVTIDLKILHLTLKA